MDKPKFSSFFSNNNAGVAEGKAQAQLKSLVDLLERRVKLLEDQVKTLQNELKKVSK
jgi:chaperonin cofactor prefoldin